jgi:Uma2 family endonuclease
MRLARFTVAQYHEMIRSGALTEANPVELLEGWIVNKMPHSPKHDATVTRIQRRLTSVLPENWLIRVQCAITTADSEPEPDLAIVTGPEDAYFKRHPRARDIAWLIEVADSTLLDDRHLKGALYAGAGIAVYWIVNLVDNKVEVYGNPRKGRASAYRDRQDFAGAELVPLFLEGRPIGEIAAKALLP